MKTKLLALTLAATTMLTSISSFAEISLIDTPNKLDQSLNLFNDKKSKFCYDQNQVKNIEQIKNFDKLNSMGYVDENGCLLKIFLNDEIKQMISGLFFDSVTNSEMKVYASDNDSINQKIIYTNSNDSQFVSNAFRSFKFEDLNSNVSLDGSLASQTIEENATIKNNKYPLSIEDKYKFSLKDKIEIAGTVLTASLVGILAERNLNAFKNPDGTLQHDKLLHSNVGAIINIGSTAASYLVIETFGLGKKLNLTNNQKKWTIILTSTLVGILVGYGKERLYDYYHQDIHTYDPHIKGDMGATWLGAGVLNPVFGSISFKF